METELIEILPRLKFSCNDYLEPLNYSDYDFVIVCGYNFLANFVDIDNKIRALGKCCTFCFEFEGKYFMFNDFGEKFEVNSSTGPKTIGFPSFDTVRRLPHIAQKNYLLELFYKIIKSKKNNC